MFIIIVLALIIIALPIQGIISVDEPGTAGVSTDEDGLPMIYPQHVLVRVYVIKVR